MTVGGALRAFVWCCFAIVCFQLPLALSAESLPAVHNRQGDYPPGDTAQITGTGFQPGEQVQCQVLRLDAPFDLSVSICPGWSRQTPVVTS